MLGEVFGRWIERIDCDSKGIFKHRRYDPSQQKTGKFKTRISVHFYEPGLEILINHEVKSKDLERKLPMFRIDD